jgi:hypothetical protein
VPSSDDIAGQSELLVTHRRTLALLLQQHAQFGILYVPPYVVHAIEQTRAEIQRVKAVLLDWGVAVEDHPDDAPPVTAVEQAGAALKTMAGLMHAPGVRDDVLVFRESFEAACRQIDLLGMYKALHDLLHDLEFKCCRPILIGAGGFPHNSLFCDSLELHEGDLQQILHSLWELAERADFPPNERAWIAQLGQADDLLRQAIAEVDKQLLDRALFQLERVLNIHPTRINERLKDAARNLPLDSLIDTLTVVHARLARAERDSTGTDEISQGIAALRQIRDNLARLIDEHDAWQRFHPELRQFENHPEQHMQQLEWLWQDLKPTLVVLCSGRSDRWTQDLQLAGERLDRALAERGAVAIASPFHAFHSRFSLCFFRADKELKEQCFKLRLVDGPLRSVMGMLG